MHSVRGVQVVDRFFKPRSWLPIPVLQCNQYPLRDSQPTTSRGVCITNSTRLHWATIVLNSLSTGATLPFTLLLLLLLLLLFGCKWVLLDDSGNTISHNTQNNPLRSKKAQHEKLHNNKQKHTTVRVTYYTQRIPLQHNYNTNTIPNTQYQYKYH
jgi:hypothetical protein